MEAQPNAQAETIPIKDRTPLVTVIIVHQDLLVRHPVPFQSFANLVKSLKTTLKVSQFAALAELAIIAQMLPQKLRSLASTTLSKAPLTRNSSQTVMDSQATAMIQSNVLPVLTGDPPMPPAKLALPVNSAPLTVTELSAQRL